MLLASLLFFFFLMQLSDHIDIDPCWAERRGRAFHSMTTAPPTIMTFLNPENDRSARDTTSSVAKSPWLRRDFGKGDMMAVRLREFLPERSPISYAVLRRGIAWCRSLVLLVLYGAASAALYLASRGRHTYALDGRRHRAHFTSMCRQVRMVERHSPV